VHPLPETGNPPVARQLLRMALDEKADRLMLFGGTSDGGHYFDDLWEFDIPNRKWTKITPVSIEKPEARIAFCMFSDSSTQLIYLFGGENELGYRSDMWDYDRSQINWAKLTTKGATAPAFGRFAYTSYRDSSNKLKLIVTNGVTMTGTDKDVYVYDVETSTWTKHTSKGDSSKVVKDSAVVYFEGKLYLFGGYKADLGTDSTLYRYDFTTETWTALKTTSTPSERGLHGMAVYGDYVYCFAGWSEKDQVDVEDVKRINLKTGSLKWETVKINGEAISHFPRESFGHVVKDSFIYFSCGWKEYGLLNDVVKLDLSQSSLKYEVLSPNFLSPPSRMEHSMHAIGTKLYMFGGTGDKGK
jgi:N-acetylneuraminic acid mutarotase